MIVIIRADATEAEIRALIAKAVALGLSHHLSRGAERAILIVSGGDPALVEQEFAALPAVSQVTPLTRPYRLAGREIHPQDTVVQVEGVLIGGDAPPAFLAGTSSPVADPAAAELAVVLRAAGATVLRTGVYRPPSSMFGTAQIDPLALQRLDELRRVAGLPVAVEVLAAEDVPAIARHADLLVVGGAQMFARPLLQACGWSNRPVLLQRGASSTVSEWLAAADHLLAGGNRQVVLCEQGIRTYEPATTHTLDLSAVPFVRRVSHLPVVVDPCHGSGQRYLVEPLALAAVAAGSHGLVLELQRPGVPAESEASLEKTQLANILQRATALALSLRSPLRDFSAPE